MAVTKELKLGPGEDFTSFLSAVIDYKVCVIDTFENLAVIIYMYIHTCTLSKAVDILCFAFPNQSSLVG